MFEGSVFFTSIWPAALTALSVILAFAEHFSRKKVLFAVISAIICTASAIMLLIFGGALCDMLLFVLITVAVRLILEIIYGRKTK